jgi:hypothetical protein
MRHAFRSALLCAAALVAGCSFGPSTKLDITWAAPQLPPAKSFQKLLIISVAPNEFVQEAFQKQLAAELQKRGVNAVASGRYFTRYTDAERDRFKRSVASSGADAILIARMTTSDIKTFEERGTLMGTAANSSPYSSSINDAFARYAYPGSYAAGADASVKTVHSETSIFAAKGEKLIWSARVRTDNAQSTTGAKYAPQYVEVILEAMKKDKLI